MKQWNIVSGFSPVHRLRIPHPTPQTKQFYSPFMEGPFSLAIPFCSQEAVQSTKRGREREKEHTSNGGLTNKGLHCAWVREWEWERTGRERVRVSQTDAFLKELCSAREGGRTQPFPRPPRHKGPLGIPKGVPWGGKIQNCCMRH